MLSAPHALVQSMAWPRACECSVTLSLELLYKDVDYTDPSAFMVRPVRLHHHVPALKSQVESHTHSTASALHEYQATQELRGLGTRLGGSKLDRAPFL